MTTLSEVINEAEKWGIQGYHRD